MDSAAATATRAQWRGDRDYGMQQEIASEKDHGDAREPVACISARQLLDLVLEARQKPAPDAQDVFPWLYGISPSNQMAASFLRMRYPGVELSSLLKPPQCSAGVLLVKYGDPSSLHPCIRGTVDVEDILAKANSGADLVGRFIDTDMIEGLQLRNFEIQSAKFARICDIVLYSTHPHSSDESRTKLVRTGLVLAQLIHEAQVDTKLGRRVYFFPGDPATISRELGPELESSLIVEPEPQVDPFDLGESDSYVPSNWDSGLPLYEQNGVVSITAVSEVLPNIWLGNFISMAKVEVASAQSVAGPELFWVTKVTCDVGAEPPSVPALDNLIRQNRKRPNNDDTVHIMMPRVCELASPNGLMDVKAVVTILSLLKLLHMRSQQYLSLILSPDGYHTCTPYAALCVMYNAGMVLSEALVYLNNHCRRSISFTPSELRATLQLEPAVYAFSPVRYSPHTRELGAIPSSAVRKLIGIGPASEAAPLPRSAAWIANFPGAFPSRILDHLYLGAFEHANNPGMLRALGISRIISVGEKLDWLSYPLQSDTVQSWGFENILHIENLQDDGVDSLLPHLPVTLSFLTEAERLGHKTLVHCRKGVSRSAAVCIAEVMRAKQWGLPQAYAHVRVHRLDVLIQPTLRLMYDLLKFEEQAPFRHGRTCDWPVLSREITRLNGEYDL